MCPCPRTSLEVTDDSLPDLPTPPLLQEDTATSRKSHHIPANQQPGAPHDEGLVTQSPGQGRDQDTHLAWGTCRIRTHLAWGRAVPFVVGCSSSLWGLEKGSTIPTAHLSPNLVAAVLRGSDDSLSNAILFSAPGSAPSVLRASRVQLPVVPVAPEVQKYFFFCPRHKFQHGLGVKPGVSSWV